MTDDDLYVWDLGSEPDPEEVAFYEAWAASRPPGVQAAANLVNPWTIYLLKTTGQRVYVIAYGEDGTVRVRVEARFNPNLDFERSVFGVDPADLVPHGVPDDYDEDRQPLIPNSELDASLDAIRLAYRPDLFAKTG